jgi:hypothetical protein
MKRPILNLTALWAGLVLCQSALATPPAQADPIAWVQYGPQGQAEIRAEAGTKSCPTLRIDGRDAPMFVRAPADNDFPPLCSAPLPVGSAPAAVTILDGLARWRELPLPTAHPQRIVVIGDSGCRIKGGIVQNCQDKDAWPFASVAAAAAALKPDLAIHVGDYPSREQPCPGGNPVCAGEPAGDTWTVWKADFFTPAAPLLATAPFVFVRGNHEECGRSGRGFLRLLGPAPFDPTAPCEPHLPAYTIPLEGIDLVVMDDSAAPETAEDEGLAMAYRKDFEALTRAHDPSWLLMHRPIFGAISGPLGLPVGGNQTLIAALPKDGIADPVRLMLSGHIHSLEVLNYGPEDRLPPQLIAGIGGDVLSIAPILLKGTIFQGEAGVRVADGFSRNHHGFALMTRNGARPDEWQIDVYDVSGHVVRRCRLADRRIDCPKDD